jgi:tRNA A-37 threonylcarbamoyl transferase component Bud32
MDKSKNKIKVDFSFIRLDKKFEDLKLLKKYLVNVFKDLANHNDQEAINFEEFQDFLNLPTLICKRIYSVFDRKKKKTLSCDDFVDGFIHLLTCEDIEVLNFIFEICDFNREELVNLENIKLILYQVDYQEKDFESELGVLDFNFRVFQNLVTKSGFISIVKNNKIVLQLIKSIYDAIPVQSDSLSILKIDKQFKTMGNVSPVTDPFAGLMTEGENLDDEITIRAKNIPKMKIKKMSQLIYDESYVSSDTTIVVDKKSPVEKKEKESNPKSLGIKSDFSLMYKVIKTDKNVRMTKEETFYECAAHGYVYKETTSGNLRRFFISIVNKDIFYFNSTKDKFIGLHHLSKCYAQIGEKKFFDNKSFYSFIYIFKNKKRVYFCEDLETCKSWVTCLKKITNTREINDYYEVSDYVIGKGHYGVVYMGHDPRSDAKVAVKVIEKEKIRQMGLKNYMELQILKICKHEHIVKLIDYFENFENLYLVLEYYPGGNLYSLFNRGDLSLNEKQIKMIMLQLAKGIKYLSERGIIHRDIKLDNILLDSFSQIKIVDFGLAVILSPEEKSYEEFGTLTYVAPEILQKRGYNKEVDIWSLGIVLFYLLVGKLPFTDPANDKNNIAVKISKREINLPKNVVNNINPLAMDLIKRCLSEQSVRISIENFIIHPWFAN